MEMGNMLLEDLQNSRFRAEHSLSTCCAAAPYDQGGASVFYIHRQVVNVFTDEIY